MSSIKFQVGVKQVDKSSLKSLPTVILTLMYLNLIIMKPIKII